MSKRLFVLVSLVIAASMLLAACGGTPTAAPATAVPAATSAGPAATTAPAGPTATLKIVSSLPMTGASLTQTQTIVNAEELRLAQANNAACGGKYAISYEPWDDASAALGKWDPAVETANANKAAADKSIIAYLGTFNSGAAKLSIPILNQAGPLVMVSPANTYGGLTTTVGADVAGGEPGKYYPTGTRNYARVVTNDNVQGLVDANFMFNKLGVKSVYVLNDNELYGQGVANVFADTAKKLGMTVLGNEPIDPKAADYKALMTKISTSNNGAAPDGIFVGMVVDNNAAQLLKDKVAIMGDNTKVKYMGPDGIQTQAFIDGAGASVAEGAYASVAGLAFPDALTDTGKKFVSDYEAKYGKLTEPYSIYGYETMNVVLAAIETVCKNGGDPTDRATVTKAVMATKDFNGVLGTWSFDANGDTTLTDMTVYQVKSGAYVSVGTFK
jgi:branched-chain amino acid transport system substrate-binding protein